MKTSELQGSALDWAVAKCEGLKVKVMSGVCYDVELLDMQVDGDTRIIYSTDWALAGPIIEREKIECLHDGGQWYVDAPHGWYEGPTVLTAAMRCYVASQLGDEVEVPEELNA